MWFLTSGDRTLLEDGCFTTANFSDNGGEISCLVSIDPEWTGFLFVEFMDNYCGDSFHVDRDAVVERAGKLGVHGMAPTSTLIWSPIHHSHRWKICQVNALPPWRVTSGHCYIDREGCFESRSAFDSSCWFVECSVEFADGWEGVLDVVDADIEVREPSYYYYYYSYVKALALLTVNGQSHVVSSDEDFFPQARMEWWPADFRPNSFQCSRVKICPMESPILSGPRGDDP